MKIVNGSLEIGQEAQFYPEGLDKRPRAPQCSETGIALPIAPYKRMDDLAPEDRNLHHANYPKSHPLLQGIGGKAVRVARLQVVPKFLHNGPEGSAFHTIIGDGIVLPSTAEEQMGAVILQSAGFLPAEVVDTTQGDLRVREMKDWERRLLARPAQIAYISNGEVKRYRDKWRPQSTLESIKRELIKKREAQARMSYRDIYYGYGEVKTFVSNYVFGQDFGLIDRKKIENFEIRMDVSSAEALLGELIGIASHSASVKGKRLSYAYKDLYYQGRLAPGMPKSAALFMRYKLGNELSRPLLIDTIKTKISSMYEVA